MARRFGLRGPHQRCHTCPEKAKCSFYFDLAADPGLKALYLDNEKYDGYFRDQCVWRPEISIEDTMNVIVGYAGGTTLSYSLNAFNAWEGYHMSPSTAPRAGSSIAWSSKAASPAPAAFATRTGSRPGSCRCAAKRGISCPRPAPAGMAAATA
jgi:hypothetical protein